jgi:hypothetical protein
VNKPQSQPVSHRPHSFASCRPTAPYLVQLHSTTAQSKTVTASQPATANMSLVCNAKPAQKVSTNSTLLGLIKPPQPQQSSVFQSAAARPAP